jgi:hypothetical protein
MRMAAVAEKTPPQANAAIWITKQAFLIAIEF